VAISCASASDALPVPEENISDSTACRLPKLNTADKNNCVGLNKQGFVTGETASAK
jgi:hypothetical protein